MAYCQTALRFLRTVGVLLIVILAIGCDEQIASDDETYFILDFDQLGQNAKVTSDQSIYFGQIAATHDDEVVFRVDYVDRSKNRNIVTFHFQPGKPKKIKLGRTYVDRKCELDPSDGQVQQAESSDGEKGPSYTFQQQLIPRTPKGAYLILNPDEPNQCVAGAFTVTEYVLHSNGSVARMAVDFEYHGVPNVGSFRGSFRYRPLVPHTDLPTLLPQAQRKPWRGQIGLVVENQDRDPRFDLRAPVSPENARSATDPGNVDPNAPAQDPSAPDPLDLGSNDPSGGTDPVGQDPFAGGGNPLDHDPTPTNLDPVAGNTPPENGPFGPDFVEPDPFDPDPYSHPYDYGYTGSGGSGPDADPDYSPPPSNTPDADDPYYGNNANPSEGGNDPNGDFGNPDPEPIAYEPDPDSIPEPTYEPGPTDEGTAVAERSDTDTTSPPDGSSVDTTPESDSFASRNEDDGSTP